MQEGCRLSSSEGSLCTALDIGKGTARACAGNEVHHPVGNPGDGCLAGSRRIRRNHHILKRGGSGKEGLRLFCGRMHPQVPFARHTRRHLGAYPEAGIFQGHQPGMVLFAGQLRRKSGGQRGLPDKAAGYRGLR